MAFHDVRLNTNISYGAEGGPSFATTIQTTASGHEYRISRQSQGRHRYRFDKNLMEASEWFALLEFVFGRRGNLHGFRFKDHRNFTTAVDGVSAPSATDKVIGVGDNSKTQFQMLLEHDQSGANPYPRTLSLPVAGSLLVALDGTPTTAYTVTNPGGVITFDTAPGTDVVISIGCEFDVPVRFDLQDEWMRMRLDEGNLAHWDRIDLVELLDEVQTPELWYPGGSSDLIELAADYTIHYGIELWQFEATANVSVYLPPPDRLPGGPRVFVVHSDSASTNTIQLRDDAGGAVGTALSGGDTIRVGLLRSGASALWLTY